MKQYLEIGEIVSTHGIAGEIKVYPWADSTDSLRRIKTVFWDEDGTCGVPVKSVRDNKGMLLLKLEGIDTIEDAHKYIGKVLFADRKQIRIAKGANFVVDLIGLEAINVKDKSHLGRVVDVTNTGVQDIYHIEKDNGEVRMVPGVEAFIKEINIEGGYVSIQPIKGLFEDED